MAVVNADQQRAAIRARWDRTAPERAVKAPTEWTRDKSPALELIAPHEIAAITHLAADLDARVRARDGAR